MEAADGDVRLVAVLLPEQPCIQLHRKIGVARNAILSTAPLGTVARDQNL
jgi:hypothetical protein